MDNVAHSLFALTLARTRLGRIGGGATAALVLSSNAPDVDLIAAAGGGIASYLQWHRGPTHGLPGILGLGVATGLAVWLAGRLRPPREGQATASLAALAAVSTVGVALHVVMDFPTSYGTRLLSPFDWRWFGLDWMPIIDIYLLAILGAGLAFGRGSTLERRRNVALALSLMTLEYGIRALAHHRALALAPRLFGPTLPQPCHPIAARSAVDVWPRAATPRPPEGPRRCLVDMAAIPTFLSPFRWRVIARLSNGYGIHDVDLLDQQFRASAAPSEALWRTAVGLPDVWTPEVEAAAAARSARIFLGFARFPAARSFVDRNGEATVVWTDLRFLRGTLSPPRQPIRPPPFAVTVRVGADNRILYERMGQ